MNWYLVESDWERCTTDVQTFRSAERALSALNRREMELFPWDGPKKVCLFRADSVDTLRTTHGSWFLL